MAASDAPEQQLLGTMALLAPLAAASSRSPPPPLPASSSTMPQIHSLLLLRRFDQLEQEIDGITARVTHLLRDLVKASRERVELVGRLDEVRAERGRLIAEELAAQAKSRDLLALAKHEMLMQETWTLEIREVYRRCDLEGVALDDVSLERLDAALVEREMRKGKKVETRTMEEVQREERAEIYGRQLLYLQHSTRQSEHRVRTLLDTLSTSRATSTSLASSLALNQLHTLTQRYSTHLSRLALDRERISLDLGALERTRAQREEKRDEVVLDLVIEWEQQRKWAAELRRAREEEEEDDEGEEGEGDALAAVQHEHEGVASVLLQGLSSLAIR
ncbi:hypothetical protein JCM10207_007411 [Rhodosporidiobolus poonsookiae]